MVRQRQLSPTHQSRGYPSILCCIFNNSYAKFTSLPLRFPANHQQSSGTLCPHPQYRTTGNNVGGIGAQKLTRHHPVSYYFLEASPKRHAASVSRLPSFKALEIVADDYHTSLNTQIVECDKMVVQMGGCERSRYLQGKIADLMIKDPPGLSRSKLKSRTLDSHSKRRKYRELRNHHHACSCKQAKRLQLLNENTRIRLPPVQYGHNQY